MCFCVFYLHFSQKTPSNLRAIYALSPIPIISPLISHDKVEIIEIAKKIGTYELSILPYGDCCSFFLADHPKLHFRDRKPEESLSMLLSSVPNLTTLISDAGYIFFCHSVFQNLIPSSGSFANHQISPAERAD